MPQEVGYLINPAVEHGDLSKLSTTCQHKDCHQDGVWLIEPQFADDDQPDHLVTCADHLAIAIAQTQPCSVYLLQQVRDRKAAWDNAKASDVDR